MLGELFAEQGLVFPTLPLLDEVDDHERTAVPLQQRIHVLSCSQRVGVLQSRVCVYENIVEANHTGKKLFRGLIDLQMH